MSTQKLFHSHEHEAAQAPAGGEVTGEMETSI